MPCLASSLIHNNSTYCNNTMMRRWICLVLVAMPVAATQRLRRHSNLDIRQLAQTENNNEQQSQHVTLFQERIQHFDRSWENALLKIENIESAALQGYGGYGGYYGGMSFTPNPSATIRPTPTAPPVKAQPTAAPTSHSKPSNPPVKAQPTTSPTSPHIPSIPPSHAQLTTAPFTNNCFIDCIQPIPCLISTGNRSDQQNF